MRILFITRKYPPSKGGMEIFAAELYAALKTRNDGITTLCAPDFAIIGRPNAWQLLRFTWKAMRAIVAAGNSFDAILLGDSLLTPLALWARIFHRGKVKLIGTAHGNDIFFAAQRSIAGRIYAFALRGTAGFLDLLIANSRVTASAAQKLGFGRIERVPLATKQQNIPSCPIPQPTLLFAGRLISYKGLSWFIEKVLPKIDERMSLLVAGPVWDVSEMRTLNSCKRAVYLGVLEQAELAALRANTTACVMPNLPPEMSLQDEGFGLSALEGPAVGTPIVATRCGGIPEAIVDGITGFVVDPLDADGFAARIHQIQAWSAEERASFSKGARQEIEENFSWSRVADDYLALMKSL